MSSIVSDAHARLGRAGKERALLWKTSLRTAMYDEGDSVDSCLILPNIKPKLHVVHLSIQICLRVSQQILCRW
jgi:hypothetical protein